MTINTLLFYEWCIICPQKLNGVANAGIVAVKTIHDSLENLASTYGFMRIELNKLSSADHPNILRFIGLTVVPPAIVLEYAPLGSLHDVSNQYKEKNCPICPSSLAMILYQVVDNYAIQTAVASQQVLIVLSCILDHHQQHKNYLLLIVSRFIII